MEKSDLPIVRQFIDGDEFVEQRLRPATLRHRPNILKRAAAPSSASIIEEVRTPMASVVMQCNGKMVKCFIPHDVEQVDISQYLEYMLQNLEKTPLMKPKRKLVKVAVSPDTERKRKIHVLEIGLRQWLTKYKGQAVHSKLHKNWYEGAFLAQARTYGQKIGLNGFDYSKDWIRKFMRTFDDASDNDPVYNDVSVPVEPLDSCRKLHQKLSTTSKGSNKRLDTQLEEFDKNVAVKAGDGENTLKNIQISDITSVGDQIVQQSTSASVSDDTRQSTSASVSDDTRQPTPNQETPVENYEFFEIDDDDDYGDDHDIKLEREVKSEVCEDISGGSATRIPDLKSLVFMVHGDTDCGVLMSSSEANHSSADAQTTKADFKTEYLCKDSGEDVKYDYDRFDAEKMLVVMKDRVYTSDCIRDQAYETLPQGLFISLSRVDEAEEGVFASAFIPNGVTFGPLRGRIIRDIHNLDNRSEQCCYVWKVFSGGTVDHYINVYDTTKSNWMRFVRSTVERNTQNTEVFQDQSNIYFRTTRDILPDTELILPGDLPFKYIPGSF